MDTEQEFKALSGQLKGAIEHVNKLAGDTQAQLKASGEVSAETKAAADKAISIMNELSARMADVEQKIVRPMGQGAPELKSMGERFIESDKIKAFLATSDRRGPPINVTMERKNITSAASTLGATASVTSSLVQADRQPLVTLPMRPLVVRDLLSPGTTASNGIEYPVQLTRNLNAAPVAEGALKPQSDLTFDQRNAPVRTIAHWFLASRQILDDAPALQSIIDAEARYGLEYLEDVQFLYGDGTGQNLTGIIPQATAFAQQFAIPGATNIDVVRQAILQASLALYPATGIVMHPTDWAKIEVTKDGQGRYLVGQPLGQLSPTLWGLPVAASMAMTPGNFLVGAFKRGAQVFDRMAIEVLLSTEDNDNFRRNLVTIRAEERLALVVYRPGAFVTGAFPN